MGNRYAILESYRNNKKNQRILIIYLPNRTKCSFQCSLSIWEISEIMIENKECFAQTYLKILVQMNETKMNIDLPKILGGKKRKWRMIILDVRENFGNLMRISINQRWPNIKTKMWNLRFSNTNISRLRPAEKTLHFFFTTSNKKKSSNTYFDYISQWNSFEKIPSLRGIIWWKPQWQLVK